METPNKMVSWGTKPILARRREEAFTLRNVIPVDQDFTAGREVKTGD